MPDKKHIVKKGTPARNNSPASPVGGQDKGAQTLAELNELIVKLELFAGRPRAKILKLEALDVEYCATMGRLYNTSKAIDAAKDRARTLRAELVTRLDAMKKEEPVQATIQQAASGNGPVAVTPSAEEAPKVGQEARQKRLDEKFTPALTALETQIDRLKSRHSASVQSGHTTTNTSSTSDLNQAQRVGRELFTALKAAAEAFCLDGDEDKFTGTVNDLTSDPQTRDVLEHPRGYWSFTAVLNKIAAAVSSLVGVKLDRSTFFRIHTTTERRVDAVTDAVKTTFTPKT